MKKLKLDLDRVVVDSFEAEPAHTARKGTVKGYVTWQSCIPPCTDWDTCGGSCPPCA